jgi:2-iminobutanoate/2-iminopropanoate deaminase
MIEFFNPPDAPAPGAFSRATGAAGLVFVSGTGAGNDIGGHAREGTAAEQTRWAIENVEAILRAAGSSLDRVNAEYVTHFPQGKLPARHTARFGVPTAAKVAFACIALGPDAPRA